MNYVENNSDLQAVIRETQRLASKYGQIGIVDSDDIVQEVMIKVLKKIDGKPTRGWLYMAVRSCAGDAARAMQRGKRPKLVSYDEKVLAVPGKQPAEVDLLPPMKDMLNKLTTDAMQVLVLHVEGYSAKEIAMVTLTKRGTVRSRLFYARRRAKELLSDLI